MFDILVNGQVVAIAAENVVKLFMNALINALPIPLSIEARIHGEQLVENEVVPADNTQKEKN